MLVKLVNRAKQVTSPVINMPIEIRHTEKFFMRIDFDEARFSSMQKIIALRGPPADE